MGGPLLLVGCGKMGGALLAGWLERSIASPVIVVEPAEIPLPRRPEITRVAAADAVPAAFRPEVVVLAVKPQAMDAVAPAYRRHAESGALVLSVAAGRTIRSLGALLGPAAIVRAMPNTPAAIGRGMTVLVANDRVSPAQRQRAEALMEAVGAVDWVAEEGLLDAVTALSGSGPAYVFLMIEAMAEAGRKAGLPAAMAMRLAIRTVEGAGCLAAESAEPPDVLRRNVTSPKGTTEAALKVLMAPDGLAALMAAAVKAAADRSRELAGPPA